jgi:dephospho-CoA kinase
MPCRLRVGLTGGIGSGKSAAAGVFAALGIPVIDADLVARELVAPGEPALGALVEAFGPGILAADGRLDRGTLRGRVFSDPEARTRLEAILHPLIRARMEALATAVEAPYCVLVIPLLVEAGQQGLVDRVLVIDVPEHVQLERAGARDGVPPSAVEAILRTQASRRERLAAADDVISNEDSVEHLGRRVRALHRRYLALAGGRLPAPG